MISSKTKEQKKPLAHILKVEMENASSLVLRIRQGYSPQSCDLKQSL